MDEVHNYSFPTEFESLSGQLTQQKGTAKVVSPEDDSQHRRLKQAKMHMKAMSKVYHKEQSEKHRLQRSLDKVTRKSTQQRMDFLRMYSCKKNRCELKEMLEQKRKDDEWMTKQSAETTKRKKLENELHSILVKN